MGIGDADGGYMFQLCGGPDDGGAMDGGGGGAGFGWYMFEYGLYG